MNNLMNPTVAIGRHEIPIGNVLATERRTDEQGQLLNEWNVYLMGGLTLRFNAEEKLQLDKEREMHSGVLYVHGMIQTLQRAQRAQ